MSAHITLVFDHAPCSGVRVDIRLPLPDPIEEGAVAMADRVCPACPICKQRMLYIGFHFSGAVARLGQDVLLGFHGASVSSDTTPELNRPFPGPGDPKDP